MKLAQIVEAQTGYGIAISHEKNTNKFEDVRLVDWATDHILDGEPSHGHDMFEKLVATVKRNNTWSSLEQIVHKEARSSKHLGSDFDDDTLHVTTKYGPFSAEEIGKLPEQM